MQLTSDARSLIEYDARIFSGEQHTLAIDHILHTLLVTTGTRAARPEPEPWAGQRLGAQVPGKVQIRNAKEMIWEIVSVDRHGTAIIQRSKAGNRRRGVDRRGRDQCLAGPRATRPNPQIN